MLWEFLHLFQSLLLAKQWNIPITSLEEYDIDLAVDGADEVDKTLILLKGGGAAHTKRKNCRLCCKEIYCNCR